MIAKVQKNKKVEILNKIKIIYHRIKYNKTIEVLVIK